MEEAKRRLLERLLDEIDDPQVIGAMERVSRVAFVPESSAHLAYDDNPLPIGDGQTISQPYIVAMMVSALELRRTDRVLEIGTGSGYQAAILAELAAEVVSVERVATLADSAKRRLETMGRSNIDIHLAEQRLGWPDGAPYNAIIVAAGAPRLAREIMTQLAVGGRLVMPVGSMDAQELIKATRTPDSYSFRTLGSCRFVPLIGEGAWDETDR